LINSVLTVIALFVIAAQGMGAWPQNLPPSSRTDFRSEVDGKVTYSDSPCLGARKVEVEPTRRVTPRGLLLRGFQFNSESGTTVGFVQEWWCELIPESA